MVYVVVVAYWGLEVAWVWVGSTCSCGPRLISYSVGDNSKCPLKISPHYKHLLSSSLVGSWCDLWFSFFTN